MARILGTNAAETLTGTDLSDRIFGFDGADTLRGGGGDDWLEGGRGADRLEGGAGLDTASYDGSKVGVFVSLVSGRGFNGDAEGDTLVGIENLAGSRLADLLVGNDADNVLTGSSGADYLDGGGGSDTASYQDSTIGVYVSLVTGSGFNGEAEGDTLVSIENVRGSAQADLLIGNNERNEFFGGLGDDTINGGGGDDTLWGGDLGGAPGDGNDTLKGGGGIDSLIGDWGDDLLDGGTEADWMSGDYGNDTYIVDNVSDHVYERSGYGTGDTVMTSVSYSLGRLMEIEVLKTTDATGRSAIDLSGNEFGNHIIGNDGRNTMAGYDGRDRLDGGGDNDRLIGGAQSDDLYGGRGADTFVYERFSDSSSATGADNIFDFNTLEGDSIDLHAIDADGNAANGDQAFAYAAGGVFHHVAGELRYSAGFLEGDVNGDGTADLSIRVNVDPSGSILM